MEDENESRLTAALRRQLNENLLLAASRELGPPPERLTALAKELAEALSKRIPEK